MSGVGKEQSRTPDWQSGLGHETEIEKRHCYSLYIGKCMENGIEVQRDAAQFYEYIRILAEEETA